MKLQRIVYFTTAALILLFSGSAAHADSISIALTQDSQAATAGSTVMFDATLTNLSSISTVYLNGDSSVTSSLLLSVSDAPFLNNAPFFLNPDEISGPYELFSVTLDPTTAPGTYDFNSFSILGGADGNSSDTLGTADFSITVVPEPSSAMLVLTGLLAVVVMMSLKLRRPISR
jgi:hypothetical protein